MTTLGSDNIDLELLDLNRSAKRAMELGDARTAGEKLRQAILLAPKSLTLRLNHAAALRQAGDVAGALESVDEALKLEPRDFNALLMKATLLDRSGREREAGRTYGLALLFTPPPPHAPPLAEAIAKAQAASLAYQKGLAAAIDEGVGGSRRAEAQESASRIGRFIELSTGRAKRFLPDPTQYYYPGLPSLEFHDRELFPWISAFEAFAPAILAELRAAKPDAFTPYVDEPETAPLDQWAQLNRSFDWSALHLVRNGRVEPGAPERFPETFRALSLLPQPDVKSRSPSAMFSVLKSKVKIPPHTGVSNARLVVHLPLVVPPNCRFRVGSETREWRFGEAWVFDDTIEHEALNDSDQDRVILIADIWNPFMSAEDREAYRAVVASVDKFNDWT